MIDDNDIFDTAQRKAIYAVGFYHITWSTTEAVIECAIAKQLGLDPIEGSIVTSGMMFAGRAKMLEALLLRDQATNKASIALLRSILRSPDRVDLTHSIVGSTESGLSFQRRKIDGGFKSKEIEHDIISLINKARDLSHNTAQLQNLLGISDSDFRDYFQIAHNAASSTGKSP